MRLVNWRALVVGAVGFGLAACGDDVTVTPPAPTITLNPTSLTCTTGQTVAVGVTVTGGSNTSIAFASGGSNLTVTPAGASGATVVCNTAGAGVINVTVTSNGQTFPATIPVTINAAQSNVLAVQISQGSATVSVGGTTTLAATVSLAPGAPANTSTAVTWTSGDPTIATVNSTTGVVTGVKAGTTTITASSVANPNLKATIPVTVTAQSLVQSLTVGSSTLTLQVGQTSQIATTVTLAPGAPAGTSTGVTCTSSTTSVATISGGTTSPCTITAVSAGQSVITVKSVADTNIRQTIGLTVGALAPVRLTIQSVDVIGPNGRQPADLTNVGGNLFLTMNLDPGDNRPDSVVVVIGGQRVNCQTFTAQLAAAYRAALQNGSADVAPITCQLNTSQFNSTTGVPLVTNGQQPLSATVFFHTGTTGTGPGTQQTATIQQILTVNNASGFFVNVANTPSASQAAVNATGQATGPQGVLWRAGDITVTVLPVNFTPVVNPGTQSFTISLQDANGIVEQRTASATSGAASYSVTFPGGSGDVFNPNGDPLGQRSLAGYTSPNAGIAPAFNPQGIYTGGGTLVVVGTQAGTGNTTVLNAAGQPAGFNGGFGNTVASPIFIDNQNPQPAINFGNPTAGPPSANFANTGTSFVGFINGGFNFQNSLTPQFLVTANNILSGTTTANPDFGGVDRVSVQFFAGSSTSATTLTGGTAITTGSQLAPNASNTAFNVAISLVDALGNRRNQRVGSGVGGGPLTINATGTAVSGNQFVSFGVDVAAPTVQQTAGFTQNTVTTNGAPLTFQFAGADETGFGLNPILVTVSRTARISSTTTPVGNQPDVASNSSLTTSAPGTYCAISADAAGNLTFADTPGGTCAPIAVAGSITLPGNANGQYSITAQARDQAGNVSTSVTRIVVVDAKAPFAGGISLPQVITGNQPANFTVAASDNLELGSVSASIGYTGTLNLRYPPVAIGTAFDNVFTANNQAIALTVPNFVRSIAFTSAAGAPGSPIIASEVSAIVADLANNTAVATVQIPRNNIAGTPQSFATGSVVSNLITFSLQAFTGNNAPGNAITISGGGTANTATSATIQTVQTGTAGTFISPFQRIELYVNTGLGPNGAPTYQFIGSIPAGLVQDNPAAFPGQRVITSSFTLTSATTPLIFAPQGGQNTYDVIAVGVSANGDALIAGPIQVNVIP
ncbi:Ig domain protein group 2 domain protein [Gemmatirosa kalamazoonensis]|uniref:Ig domain protein group 2 domain protein n=1 Tax=Gemmatirosa kalamazoonensis TaxID=861299 RepID=W0RJE8_9BACT|nr:Ig-like domain-containing protein [Gemmatirosa kalamazoonensis]AHG90460.1 Ig domain protein group 2 domain protein [Gemmatirosa kalamazoonensis]